MGRMTLTIAGTVLALAFCTGADAAPGGGGGGGHRAGGAGGGGMQQMGGTREQRRDPAKHESRERTHDNRGVGRPDESAGGEGRKVQRRPTREDDGFGRPIYGGEMMSAQEREQFRDQMRNAGDEGERERLRTEHRGMILQRARERGETVQE